MRRFKKILYFLAAGFILLNVIAMFHAWKFTHFTNAEIHRTGKPENLGFFQKIRVLVTDVSLPRPEDHTRPTLPFEEITLNGHDGNISCWYFPKAHAKGIVVLCHGYGASRSDLMPEAAAFDSLGYATMLMDFMGSGASDGNRTTIGYYEADDVAAVFQEAKKRDSNVMLFGISMGASAILRACSVHHIIPSKIILQCPYGSMLTAAKNRFAIMGVPSFPAAGILVFWGGLENGYWAFNQKSTAYAADVTCPVLLMRGRLDRNVTEEETQGIFSNLKGLKTLTEFDNCAHESFCLREHEKWISSVHKFLAESH